MSRRRAGLALLGTAALAGTLLVGAPAQAAEVTPIAAIQGTRSSSPLVGQTVTTEGVVTAAYPTGGYRGIFLQTEGTGGDVDLAEHRASDGIFVFSGALAADVRVGDHVRVTGPVSEYQGLTEVSPAAGGWTTLDEPAEAVKPASVRFPLDEQQRESLEGMLLRPVGPYTITNNYTTNSYGEIGLAAGREPLRQPTDVARPDSAEAARVAAENARRLVTLDDGASVNYGSGANRNQPVPWLRPDNEVRTGAPVTFTKPVVLDYRNDLWKLQPTSQLLGDRAADEPVTIGATRTAAPAKVGGDLRIGTFNVLNYFPTTGEDWVRSGRGTCTFYTDRSGARTTVNSCTNNGPRGAADAANLKRQQDKIVTAINRLGAEVVSLEEIENSRTLGGDRDAALATLVRALNDAAGSDVWDYVRSPRQVPASEDVIRTAFIYKKAKVAPVGESTIDDDPAFDNARDPLAQEFRPVGSQDRDDFVVIVNHFKSKGSGTGEDADQGDGQGASNASRVKQAKALVAFADAQAEAKDTETVFLTGDFNSYREEDPVRVIQDAGFTDVASRYTRRTTYQFDGLVGSLDHVFASRRALKKVTGADIWDINADESVAREYSRWNANVTNLYAPDPYRASDHDPEVVGFDAISRGTHVTVADDVAGPPRRLTVSVYEDGEPVRSGAVVVTDGWWPVGVARVRDGRAEVPLVGLRPSTRTLTLAFTGAPGAAPAVTTYTLP
ncbi:MAG: ExeM/NucH family extracellular endonuclease [Aeromicrobium erythreum]